MEIPTMELSNVIVDLKGIRMRLMRRDYRGAALLLEMDIRILEARREETREPIK